MSQAVEDERIAALQEEIRRVGLRARRREALVRASGLLAASLAILAAYAASFVGWIVACGPWGSSESLVWPPWALRRLLWSGPSAAAGAVAFGVVLRLQEACRQRERRRLANLLAAIPPEQQALVIRPLQLARCPATRETAWFLKHAPAAAAAATAVTPAPLPAGRGSEVGPPG